MKSRRLTTLGPELIEQIRGDLAAHFPTLHIFVEGGTIEVRGTFPVIGEGGAVLDRFQVTITLPPTFPKALPITRETGGRLPWTMERHVEEDGTACVLLPDERWRVFPVGASFMEYLKGPLHSFFLSQMVVEAGGTWPFGEWGHGSLGILEYYRELLGLRTPATVLRYLKVLRRTRLRPSQPCPCGSGASIAGCCLPHIQDLRQKIDCDVAAKSYAKISSDKAILAMIENARARTPTMTTVMRSVGSARSASIT